MKSILSIPLVALFAAPLSAQTVSDCDWESSARNLIEPWEDHTKVFAEGAVRLAMLDTVEPAVAAMHLLVLSPPYDEVGDRQCKTIGSGDRIGFSGIRWDALTAGYDPAAGLIFEVPVSRYDPESDGFPTSLLSFTLNQSTGEIDAVILADTE
ncbi:hypothetical protein MWU61_15505 [Loktanella sp. F6476L]|uniref:hypothetical protein n=1 Tax=Loktanella sp. F6476L TaxID=2926405 RepID=UPI001FF6C7E6|nr:hypothetical protein [Loktanella sp. F6476L]MCK0121958.1 hypothetical protein [Loktanella sp. F6476L]